MFVLMLVHEAVHSLSLAQNVSASFMVQIMLMLTRQQARPEIPDINSLPGPAWSGIGGFVSLMQVCMSMQYSLVEHNSHTMFYLAIHIILFCCSSQVYQSQRV